MSPVAFVLVIDTGEVAAALELLRRVCDPRSRSLPHITVRYSAKRPPQPVIDEITRAVIDDLIVVRPETFDADKEDGVRTVVLGCESDSLEWRSHKPDYPDSYFHITIYDGPRSEFAGEVLRTMSRFAWNLRLDATAARVVEASPSNNTEKGPTFSDAARDLFKTMFPSLAIETVSTLSDASRLAIVRELCERIHRSSEVSEADRVSPTITSKPTSRMTGQNSFWSEQEIAQLSGVPLRVHHKRTGTFLTPPEVALEVARCALEYSPSTSLRFLDPAIGPGVFFATVREAARELGLEVASATGVEADYGRAERTATRWRRAGLHVVHADFLEYEPNERESWNLLVANPPYIRHQKQADSFKRARARLSSELELPIDGRSDAYIYFVLAAHRLLDEGGIAAWLLPSEFFFTQSGSALRSYLLERVELLRVHTFDIKNSVFDHAKVTSTVVVYRKSTQRPSLIPFSEGGGIGEPARSAVVGREGLDRAKRWAPLGLPPQAPPENTVPISDFARIQRGIATGANSLFVLTDSDLEKYEVRDRWVKPLLPRPRHLQSARIEADVGGAPRVTPRLWLIDTEEKPESIRRSSPVFADYLQRIADEVGDRRLLKERKPFYRQERRLPAPIVVASMSPVGRVGRRFFRNESRALVLNNYLCVYVDKERLSPDAAFAWLMRNEERIIEGAGRNYSSNLVKLEPGELRQIRLPPPQ